MIQGAVGSLDVVIAINIEAPWSSRIRVVLGTHVSGHKKA